MADEFLATDDLALRFANLGTLGEMLSEANRTLAHIHAQNLEAAGGDEYGRQYTEQVVPATRDLGNLTGGLSGAMDSHAQAGADTTKVFNGAEGDAGDLSHFLD